MEANPLSPHCKTLASPGFLNFSLSMYAYSLLPPFTASANYCLQSHPPRYPPVLPPPTLPNHHQEDLLRDIPILRPPRDNVRNMRVRKHPRPTQKRCGHRVLQAHQRNLMLCRPSGDLPGRSTMVLLCDDVSISYTAHPCT